jgi:hypothetical protein
MQQILSSDTELVGVTCGNIFRFNSERDNLVCGDGKIVHTAGKGGVRMHVLREV